MVTWFAGLFYLPRLFVYHAMAEDDVGIERFKVMERKLFFGIMNPGAALTLVFGLWLVIAGLQGYLQGVGRIRNLLLRILISALGLAIAFSFLVI